MKKTSYIKFGGAIIILMALFSITFAAPTPPLHVHAHVTAPKPGTGELSIEIKAPATESFTLKIYDSAGVVSKEITVNGGSNILPSLTQGKYTFELFNATNEIVEKGKFSVMIPAVKPPKPDTTVHVHAHMKGTRLNDTLRIHVHALVTENFVLTIFDSAGVSIHTLPVTGGENILPALPLGSYTFNLKDSSDVVVETGKFKIKPEHVHAHVKGKYYNDTLNFHVHADSSESFTLTIYNEADSVLYTITVNGGDNWLPSLAVGRYSFILVDEDDNQVEEGKFSVKVRPVHTGIHPNPSDPGDGNIFVDAPVTESFSLKIYDSSLVLLHSESIPGGTTVLPALPSGIYYYKVINSDGYEVSKGRILIY